MEIPKKNQETPVEGTLGTDAGAFQELQELVEQSATLLEQKAELESLLGQSKGKDSESLQLALRGIKELIASVDAQLKQRLPSERKMKSPFPGILPDFRL